MFALQRVVTYVHIETAWDTEEVHSNEVNRRRNCFLHHNLWHNRNFWAWIHNNPQQHMLVKRKPELKTPPTSRPFINPVCLYVKSLVGKFLFLRKLNLSAALTQAQTLSDICIISGKCGFLFLPNNQVRPFVSVKHNFVCCWSD